MMKRVIAFLLAVMLAAGILAGCGGSGGTSNSNGTNTNAGEKTTNASAESNLLQIDFFSAIEMHYSGVDGFGFYSYGKDLDLIDYDKSDEDITKFLQSVKLTIDLENNTARNGDVLNVTLSYSHSDAEALGLTLKETSKSYTVEGLEPVWRNAQEADLDKAYAYLNESMENWWVASYPYEVLSYYWFYTPDGCGEPFISGIVALATYEGYDGTEFEYTTVCVVDYWRDREKVELMFGEEGTPWVDLEECTSASEAMERLENSQLNLEKIK